jgi:arylsulfatase A-like enzyme
MGGPRRSRCLAIGPGVSLFSSINMATVWRADGRASWTCLASWLILAGAACGGTVEETVAPPDRIILITIDTLRADHLPSFGYPIDTAPFLTSLAAQSVSFSRAFAQSATTGPSHASIFTSLYPLQHGVQNNAQRLDESFVTLAERLSERGYDTAAFVSGNAHFGASRIAQGFEDYDQPGKEIRNSNGNLMLYRPADQTTDSVLRWLESRSIGRPLFLWVHYFDPHKPLRPPAVHLEQIAPRTDDEREGLAEFLVQEHDSVLKRPKRLDQIIRYDAEIRFADTHIERLFNGVRAHEPEASTLWVITSDHGQGLANHDWFGHHRYIYNEQVHVPLFFHFSDGRVAPRVVDDQLVEHVDVPVTLLELVGETLEGQVGAVQGRSLMPLLSDVSGYEHRRFAFSERRRVFMESSGTGKEPGERYALQSHWAKYLWFSEGRDEYYDLSVDPYETRNLIDEPSSVKDDLQATLEQIVGALRSEKEATVVDEETLDRLRSLGYLR